MKLELTGSSKSMGQLSIYAWFCFASQCLLVSLNSFLTKVAAIWVTELCSLRVVNQYFAGTLSFRLELEMEASGSFKSLVITKPYGIINLKATILIFSISSILLLFVAGLGYGQMFATVMVLIYYCSLMALTVFYFIQSFASELPWSTCADEWDMCFDSKNSGGNVSDAVNLTGRKSSSELYF